MVIYVWPDGEWCYDFMFDYRRSALNHSYKMINLDRLYDYKDLTKEEIKACEDALSD